MIESVLFYLDQPIGYKVGSEVNNDITVTDIKVIFSKVVIFFSDGYKIAYKNVPYSIQYK